jgi:transcriptional regulator with GAF, ATPase, and Fis domain
MLGAAIHTPRESSNLDIEMAPKLIVIAGSPQGAVFILGEDELSIGREAVNQIRLVDPSVSRRHAIVKREDEHFKLVDLNSFNGTSVNGVPVLERLLEHGDQVAVGDVLLLFLLREAEDDANLPRVDFDDSQLATQSTVRLRRQDAFYLHPEKVLAILPPTARVARDLNTLLKISTVINAIQDLEKLQHRLLELLFEVIPAEHGVVLLAEGSSEELVPSATASSKTGAGSTILVSRTVSTQVLREGVAIMCNDVSTNEPIGPSESLVGAGISGILCVPLVLREKRLGVIYLDASDPAARFDEHHLQLLTAIAGIAAMAVENMQHAEQLRSENQRLQGEASLTHQMVGEGRRMRDLYRFIEKVAAADSTVLIRGESGTGKELAAQAIHQNSPRSKKPFVAINCATLTEALLASELFGHEKGAFTGAIALKRGKLEVAEGGTLFLDEVGELAIDIQAKLLRVLEKREIVRVGGTKTIKVDIRIVAATNRNLEEAVCERGFREDLYYRLNVISFVTPPLRERREDIPLLANYFVAECSRRAKRKPMRISAEARSYLTGYDWPGNVRELANVIERAVVLGSTDMILPEDLPEPLLETAASAGAPISEFYNALRETKKQLILKAIQQSAGNYTTAAGLLGIRPNNLHRLVRQMDLRKYIDE